jgi:hypothetical protein
VVVVKHRPQPEGWDAEAPFHLVDGVEAAVAKAQELAGDRMVEVAAWGGRWPCSCSTRPPASRLLQTVHDEPGASVKST